MRVSRLSSASAVAQAAADLVAEAVADRPAMTLGLPTGRTMVPFYRELELRFRSERLDLSRVKAFNLDELLLPDGHPATFARYMQQHAWARIGLEVERCEIPRFSGDPEAECRRYDAALAAAAPLDLVFLGLGADGHVAYNLPGPPHHGTHMVELPEATAEALGVPLVEHPLCALTMGFGPLLRARRLVLLATTTEKRDAVRRMLAGTGDPKWPCTLLLDHPDLHLLLTPQAGGDIKPWEPARLPTLARGVT